MHACTRGAALLHAPRMHALPETPQQESQMHTPHLAQGMMPWVSGQSMIISGASSHVCVGGRARGALGGTRKQGDVRPLEAAR